MNWNEYGAFIIEETKNLLAIDSPSGMTKFDYPRFPAF